MSLTTPAGLGHRRDGGGPLTSQDMDVYAASFDATGAHRWSRKFGGTGADWGYDVDVDVAGNLKAWDARSPGPRGR
ncbi:hypothetical protein ACLESO_55355, partial [Pyxidicoccus sp. 3LG]